MPTKKKISEKTDKRRRAKIIVGHDAKGDPIIKYASGRTNAELAAAADELRKKYIGGEAIQREIMFSTYLDEWYAAYKEDKLSPSSKANYTTAMNKHILPAIGNRQMRAIRAAELQLLLNEKSGMGKTTIGDIYSIITNVFARATADGTIDRNPALGLVRPEASRESRRALTDAETKAALAVAASHPDGLLLSLLYYTGMRRGEALGLQWRDIDFDAGTISICRDMDFVVNDLGKLKTSCSRRTIPIPAALNTALDAARGIGATPVLQSPRNHSHWPQATFVRRWKSLVVAMYAADPTIEAKVISETQPDAGEPIVVMGSILTPHYFRHNYASILYNAKVDVLAAQRILGHADVKTTLSIYSHLSKQNEDNNRLAVVAAFDQK